jgi:hypothetical protein
MTQDEVFTSLVDNAFDFLQRSTRELGKHPKYSLIHFCAAVDLFMKARLMREHWSLILIKPESADWKKFCEGEPLSVGLEQADDRLRSIAQDGLSDEEHKCFSRLAKHRNKVIHFRHPRQEDMETFRAQVAAEQLCAWFYLHRILITRWRPHFSSIAKTIERMEKTMRKRREYLKAKFDALKPELDAHIQAGKRLDDCPSCGFKALVVEESLGELFDCCCEVCDWVSYQLELECPDCKHSVVLRDEGRGSCANCGKDFEPEDVVEILLDPHDAYRALKEGNDELSTGNCSLCESMGTLIPFHDKYLCANCLDVCEERWQCNWCGEYTNREMGPSVVEGCFNCSDAREEWMDKQ